MPITVWLLERIVKFLDKRNLPGDDILACCFILCFFGFLRCRELLDLQWDHVLFAQDGRSAKVHLDCSKMDIFRIGVDVDYYFSGGILCPITRLLGLRRKFPNSRIVFPWGKKHISYECFQKSLKSILRSFGLSENYDTHSFRIGAASSLAILGYEAHIIKPFGRWKSLAFQTYTQIDEAKKREVAARLANVRSLREETGGRVVGVESISVPIESDTDIDKICVRFSGYRA
jgi:integrase